MNASSSALNPDDVVTVTSIGFTVSKCNPETGSTCSRADLQEGTFSDADESIYNLIDAKAEETERATFEDTDDNKDNVLNVQSDDVKEIAFDETNTINLDVTLGKSIEVKKQLLSEAEEVQEQPLSEADGHSDGYISGCVAGSMASDEVFEKGQHSSNIEQPVDYKDCETNKKAVRYLRERGINNSSVTGKMQARSDKQGINVYNNNTSDADYDHHVEQNCTTDLHLSTSCGTPTIVIEEYQATQDDTRKLNEREGMETHARFA